MRAARLSVNRIPSTRGISLLHRQLTPCCVRLEQGLCRILRLLHVGFIERIDLEDPPRRSGRDFPPEELRPKRLDIGHVDRHQRSACRAHPIDCLLVGPIAVDPHDHRHPVVAGRCLRRLASDRNDALSLLTGALRDKLFDPQSERLETIGNEQCQLVAAARRRRAISAPRATPGFVLGSVEWHAFTIARVRSTTAARGMPIKAAGTIPKKVSAE